MIGHWVEFEFEESKHRGICFAQSGTFLAVVVMGVPSVFNVPDSPLVTDLGEARLPNRILSLFGA